MGRVGNWPQSHRTRSTHFRETARHRRLAMRNQAATHFPASPVVLPSTSQLPVASYLRGTTHLLPAAGLRRRPASSVALPVSNEDQKPAARSTKPEDRSSHVCLS